MEDIILEARREYPAVSFKTNGELSIEGYSYPEHLDNFYQPLVNFASLLECREVHFRIYLEYMNTGSAKYLLNILRAIEGNNNINSVNIEWHYDTDDEEYLEQGEMLEDLLEKCRFTFYENMLVE